MGMVGDLVVNLGMNSRGFASEAGSARGTLKGFASSVSGSLKGMGGFALGLGAMGAGLLGVGSAFAAVGAGVSSAMEMEQAEVAFGTLLGSADTAKAVLGDLSKFAAETPFELPELTNAGRSLAAFGFAAGDIVPNMRMIGDLAAGTGQPIGELAEIYGKARVQGRLFGEDINQLTGRGIPVIQELAKQFGVGESQVKKLVEQGKIGFPQLEKAFQSMTGSGGKFEGMMKAQSGTLAGIWSTFKDNVGANLRDAAAFLSNAFNIKGLLSGASEFVGGIKGKIAELTASPLFQQFVNMTIARFRMLKEQAVWMWEQLKIAGTTAFTWLRDLAGSVFPEIGASGSFSLQTLKDLVLDFMIAAEFAFTNWKQFGTLAFTQVLLSGVQFFAEIGHFFMGVLPAYFAWFSENWQNTFFTALDYTLTLFINLGTNIRALWQGVLDFIAGNGFHVDWTPLTEGAVSAMSAMPEIPERMVGEFEKGLLDDVGRMTGNLAAEFDQFSKDRKASLTAGALAGPATATTTLTPSGPAGAPAATGAAKAASEFGGASRGSKEALDRLLKAGGRDREASDRKKQIQIEQQTRDAVQQMATAITNGAGGFVLGVI